MKKIDMHTHTTLSDGTSIPTQLVEGASQKGVEFLCITDHDIASDSLIPLIQSAWIATVPSVEISSQNSYNDRKSLHLTYYSRGTSTQIQDIISNTRRSKKDLIALQLLHLQKLWFFIDLEEFYTQLKDMGRQDDGLSKYDIARYVASKEENLKRLWELWCTGGGKVHTQFYTRCLKRKWELYGTYAVEVDDYEPEVEVLGQIRVSQDAILSIAHPNFSFSKEGITGFLEIFPQYKELWVNAVEINTRATKKWIEAVVSLKDRFPDVQITFWSDCHQIGKPDEKHGDLGFSNAHIDSQIVLYEFAKFCERVQI